MSRLQDSHRRINAEIAQEKAAALGRRLDAASDPAEHARLLGEYESARVRAIHARLTLVIQREALGLRHHRIVDQQFPEPPRRTR